MCAKYSIYRFLRCNDRLQIFPGSCDRCSTYQGRRALARWAGLARDSWLWGSGQRLAETAAWQVQHGGGGRVEVTVKQASCVQDNRQTGSAGRTGFERSPLLALTTCIISGQVTRASVSLSVKTTPTSWDCRHSRCLIMAPFLLLFFLVGKEILLWWKSPWQPWHLGVPPHFICFALQKPLRRGFSYPLSHRTSKFMELALGHGAGRQPRRKDPNAVCRRQAS